MNESLTFCAATRSIEEPDLHSVNARAETMTARSLSLLGHNNKPILKFVIGVKRPREIHSKELYTLGTEEAVTVVNRHFRNYAVLSVIACFRQLTRLLITASGVYCMEADVPASQDARCEPFCGRTNGHLGRKHPCRSTPAH